MYRGRYFTREQVCVCGDYMDADVYPVFQPAGKRRKKCRPTKEIQKRLNQRNAERRLTRLVHNNFTADDLALHLTYRPGSEPEDEEQAGRDLRNFLRRVKRRYLQREIEFKYIACTEFGKRSGRVHHHLIISGGYDRDELEKIWGKGYANSKRLQFGDDGVTGLTHYMVKDKHFYKRWNASRNLVQPEPAVFDSSYASEDVREAKEAIDAGRGYAFFEERYPEFICTDCGYEENGINHGIYIHYEMRRRR